MTYIVAGTRNWTDPSGSKYRVIAMLDRYAKDADVLVTGGASGVDAWAAEWAKFRGVESKVFDADWGKYGKAAGPIRNRRMAEFGKAVDATVILFPGGAGTASMKREAERAGLRIIEIEPYTPMTPEQQNDVVHQNVYVPGNQWFGGM